MIPSDDDLALSMIRPMSTKTGAVLVEGFWSVVMPVVVLLPECAMVSQEITMNVREVNKIRLRRDCR